jgi:hypothetical protein
VSRARRIGFPFVPLPQADLDALAGGSLDAVDLAVRAFLWKRAVLETRKATATLAQIAEGIRWKKTEDALYRRPVRLNGRAWTFETTRGRHGAPYVFTLNPALNRSEHPPMSERGPGPMSDELEKRTALSVATPEADGRSDEPEPAQRLVRPMSTPSGPMSGKAARPLPERHSSPPLDDAGPMTSEVQKTSRTEGGAEVLDQASVEGEGTREPGSLEETESFLEKPNSTKLERPQSLDALDELRRKVEAEVVERVVIQIDVSDDHEAEAALLAEAEQLVADGVLVEVDEEIGQ